MLPPFLDVVHLSVCLFVCCFELSVLNWILILNYLSVVLSCCPDELESSMSVVLNCPVVVTHGTTSRISGMSLPIIGQKEVASARPRRSQDPCDSLSLS